MLSISENVSINYHTSPEKAQVSEFINKKVFKVADTPLTYRQINSLDSDNLLSMDRENSKGWHTFSFKELVYLYIVSELKRFGLKHEQLNQLWEAFFKKPTLANSKKVADIEINKGTGEMALGCVFMQIEIILCVDNAGQIVFYDALNYSLLYQSSKPQIHINLNSIVNNLLNKSGHAEIPVANSVQDAVLQWKKVDLTSKEEELLEIIRNDDYTTIQVKKKDGKVALVHAGKTLVDNHETTVKDIVKMISAKDYQDISISQRGGKIVNYKIEETIKL